MKHCSIPSKQLSTLQKGVSDSTLIWHCKSGSIFFPKSVPSLSMHSSWSNIKVRCGATQIRNLENLQLPQSTSKSVTLETIFLIHEPVFVVPPDQGITTACIHTTSVYLLCRSWSSTPSQGTKPPAVTMAANEFRMHFNQIHWYDETCSKWLWQGTFKASSKPVIASFIGWSVNDFSWHHLFMIFCDRNLSNLRIQNQVDSQCKSTKRIETFLSCQCKGSQHLNCPRPTVSNWCWPRSLDTSWPFHARYWRRNEKQGMDTVNTYYF